MKTLSLLLPFIISLASAGANTPFKRPNLPIDQGWTRFAFGAAGSAVAYNVAVDGYLELTLTDAFCPGDAFFVHLNDGPLLFSTPLVPSTGPCQNTIEDADAALASGLFSSATFCGQFKAGDKLSIIVRRDGTGGGKGFIKAKSLPNGCPVVTNIIPTTSQLPFSAVAPALPTTPPQPANVVVAPSPQPTSTAASHHTFGAIKPPTNQVARKPVQGRPAHVFTFPKQPAQGNKQPMQPAKQPMQPAKQPMQPAKQPMQPAKQPMQGAQGNKQPMQPAKQPMQGAKQPAKKPAQPAKQPAKKVEKIPVKVPIAKQAQKAVVAPKKPIQQILKKDAVNQIKKNKSPLPVPKIGQNKKKTAKQRILGKAKDDETILN